MSYQLRIEIYRQDRLIHADDIDRPVELGRQQSAREPLFSRLVGQAADRLVVAPLEERTVSRRHLLVEPLAFDHVRITNLTTRGTVQIADTLMEPGMTHEMGAPYELTIGNYRVRFLSALPPTGNVPAPAPAATSVLGRPDPVSIPTVDLGALAPDQSESLILWLQAITTVLQSAAHSDDFFHRAAGAVVELVGLDTGRVLLYSRDHGWSLAATQARTSPLGGASDREPSHRILERMRNEGKTTTRQGTSVSDARGSLADIEAVVVSPIVNRSGEVIGALYGDRFCGSSPIAAPEISKADILLMETLACGIGAGLARLEHERAAIEARVRFEQFFTPELARQLAVDPNLLAGRDSEVTLMFCDIRDFSGISERISETLPAGAVMQWINDVFGTLSECVLEHQGVLVDYLGDEMIAMWGAPAEQPDHARLACRAAADMWRRMPEISERWRSRLGAETRVGIGLNTGLARVGNIGSQRKFKYGALGDTVNMCSRVQGASKYLQAGILLTDDTRSAIGDDFSVRRLGLVRVVNIKTPVMLYELRASPDRDWSELCARYEEALRQFEDQHPEGAMSLLRDLLNKFPDDGPSLVLLSRVVPLLNHLGPYSHIYEVPGK